MKRPVSSFSIKIDGFGTYESRNELDVNRVTLLIGPNGSGKTTFLSLLPLLSFQPRIDLAKEIVPDVLDGRIVNRLRPGNRIRLSLAYLDTLERSFEPFVGDLDYELYDASEYMRVGDKLFDEVDSDSPDRNEQELRYREELHHRVDVISKLGRRESDDDLSRYVRNARKKEATHRVELRSEYMVLEGPGVVLKRQKLEILLCNGETEVVTIFAESLGDEKLARLPTIALDLKPLRQYRGLRNFVTEIPEDLWLFDEEIHPSPPTSDLRRIWHASEPLQNAMALRKGDPLYAGVGKLVKTWLQRFFVSHIEQTFGTILRTPIGSRPQLDILPQESVAIGSREPYQNSGSTIGPFVRYWLRKLKIASEVRKRRIEGTGYVIEVYRQTRWINVFELGAGLSRFVLLLIALGNSRADTFLRHVDDSSTEPVVRILEEPEANLHPGLHTNIAELLVDHWNPRDEHVSQVLAEESEHLTTRFAEVYGQKVPEGALDLPFAGATCDHVTYMVETHSEYIVRRYQAMIAHGLIPSDEVGIIYFSDPSLSQEELPQSGETVWSIGFNEDGTLTRDFGPGFFGEAANLIDDLWNAWRPKS